MKEEEVFLGSISDDELYTLLDGFTVDGNGGNYNTHKKNTLKNKRDDKKIAEAIKSLREETDGDKFVELIQLSKTDVSKWKNYTFVTLRRKRHSLMNFANKLAKNANDEHFKIQYYRFFIFSILDEDVRKKDFPTEILKNLYIGKLQSIVAILSKLDENGELLDAKEALKAKSTKKTMGASA